MHNRILIFLQLLPKQDLFKRALDAGLSKRAAAA